MSTVNDVEELKTKVLDQRICIDNMADRMVALEDNFDDLVKVTNSLVKLLEKQL